MGKLGSIFISDIISTDRFTKNLCMLKWVKTNHQCFHCIVTSG